MEKTFKKQCKRYLAMLLSIAMLLSFIPSAAFADAGELPNLLALPNTHNDWGEPFLGVAGSDNMYKYDRVGMQIDIPEFKAGGWLPGTIIKIGKSNNGAKPSDIKSGISAEILLDGQPVDYKMETDHWNVCKNERNSIGLKPKGYGAVGTVTFKFDGYKPIDFIVKGPKDPNAPTLKDYWTLAEGDPDYGQLCQEFIIDDNSENPTKQYGIVENKKVVIKRLTRTGVRIGKLTGVKVNPIESGKQAKIYFNQELLDTTIENEDWTVNNRNKNYIHLTPKKYGLTATLRYEFEGYEPFTVIVKGPEEPVQGPKDFFKLDPSDRDYAQICYNSENTGAVNWVTIDEPEIQLLKLGKQDIKIGRYNGTSTIPSNLKSGKSADIYFNNQLVVGKAGSSNRYNKDGWEVIADKLTQGEDANHVRISSNDYDLEGKLRFEFDGIKPFEVTVRSPKNTAEPEPPVSDENFKVIYQNPENQRQWIQAEQDETTGLYRVIVKPGAQRKLTIGKFLSSTEVEGTEKNVTFTDEKGGRLPISGDDTNYFWRFPQAGKNFTTISSGTTSDRKVILAKIEGRNDIKIELISSAFPEKVAKTAKDDGILFSHKETNKDGTTYWRTLYGNGMKASYDWKKSHTFKATLNGSQYANITAEDYGTNESISLGGDSRKEATIKFKNAKTYILHAKSGNQSKDATIVIEKPEKAFIRYATDGITWHDIDDQTQPEIKDGFLLGKEIEFMPDDGTENPWAFSGEGNYEEMVTMQPFGGIRIRITPIKEGDVTLKTQNIQSREKAYIKFKVISLKAKELSLTPPTSDIFVGDTVKIGYDVTPSNTTDMISWSVEPEKAGNIDKAGNFTALKAGKATIKASINGIEKELPVTIKEPKNIKIYFKSDKDGKKTYLDDNDMMTLKLTESGHFFVENEDIKVRDWDAKEKYWLNWNTWQIHWWIDGGQFEKGTRFNPRRVARQPATLVYEKDGRIFEKHFTLDVIPSGIEEIKVYEKGKEIAPTEVMQVQGRERRYLTVKGRQKDSSEFVDLPDTAYDIVPKYMQHIIGSSFALWTSEDHVITLKMRDNEDVKFEFTAHSNYVPVTGLKGEVPKKWYIDTWSPFDQYTGIRWYDDINDGYTLQVDPEIASNITLNWEALTPEIAIYDPNNSNGIVPKKAGLAKFKVTSDDNPEVSKDVQVEFAYKAPLQSVSADATYEVKAGESKDLHLNITPSNATEQRFHWTYEGDGEIVIKDKINIDPNDVNVPKWTTHKIIGKKDGTVKVTGTPYDQTEGAKPVTFTVRVGKANADTILDMNDILEWAHNKMNAIATSYGDSSSVKDPWMIAELGKLKKPVSEADLAKVHESVLEDGRVTNNVGNLSKAILALRASGIDPEKYYGHNLVEALAKMDVPEGEWAIYSLSPQLQALSSDREYVGVNQATDKIIHRILASQRENGLWGSGEGWQDATGFALYALAPYYDDSMRPEIKVAFEKAVEGISQAQLENGDVVNNNSNSLVMVLGGLVSANHDYLTDQRLVKNNKTMLHALKEYDLPGQPAFKWKKEETAKNAMATEQAFRSLIACFTPETVFDYTDYVKHEITSDEEALTNARLKLQEQIDAAEKLLSKEKEYKAEEVAALKQAVNKAKSLLEATNSKEQLLDAADKLKKQVEEMKKAPVNPGPVVTDITVNFTLKGMAKNGTTEETWVSTKAYTIPKDSNILYVFDKALKENNIDYFNKGNYISKIKSPLTGEWLAEKDNGPNSGWMYTVNGIHPDVGLESYILKGNENIVWHYTNDYKEEPDFNAGSGIVGKDNPEITMNDQVGTTKYDSERKTLTITPKDGYKVKDVFVNGQSKGDTAVLTGIQPTDKIKIVFEKVKEEKTLTEDEAKKIKSNLKTLDLNTMTEKTKKGNVKVRVKTVLDKKIVEELLDKGCTVEYRFYRSTDKYKKFKKMMTKSKKVYYNTYGKDGQRYYYRTKMVIKDSKGKIVAQTRLNQSEYGCRIWRG